MVSFRRWIIAFAVLGALTGLAYTVNANNPMKINTGPPANTWVAATGNYNFTTSSTASLGTLTCAAGYSNADDGVIVMNCVNFANSAPYAENNFNRVPEMAPRNWLYNNVSTNTAATASKTNATTSESMLIGNRNMQINATGAFANTAAGANTDLNTAANTSPPNNAVAINTGHQAPAPEVANVIKPREPANNNGTTAT